MLPYELCQDRILLRQPMIRDSRYINNVKVTNLRVRKENQI